MPELETKQILALIVLVGLGAVGIFATLISQRMRDWALFAFVVGAVLIEKMNVTFLGEFWYRGTSRGVEISAIDVIPFALLISHLFLPRYERGRFYWPAGLGLMLFYLFYCIVSVMRSDPSMYGMWEVTKVLRGLVVLVSCALFIRSRRELAVVVLALAFTASLEGLSALEQRFARGVFRTPGTLDHENTLSTYLCMIAPVLLAAAMSHWSKGVRWAAGLGWVIAAGGEMLTLSRLGIPVFACVSLATALACTSWRVTRRKVAFAAAALAVVAGFVYVSWDGLKARYTHSDIRAEFTDTQAYETRGVYWRLAFEMVKDHPFGVGLNNWSYAVGKTYGAALGYKYTAYDDIKWIPTMDDTPTISLPPAADTLPALVLGELGIAGFGIFLLMWLRWLQLGVAFLRDRLNSDPMHRLGIGMLFGLLGVFLQSATEWTYKQTPVMFTCHVLLGALAGLTYARRSAVAVVKQPRVETDRPAAIQPLPVTIIPVPK